MSRLPEQTRNIILPGISCFFCLSCFPLTANRRAESRPSDLHPQCFPRTAFAEKKEAEVSPPPPVSLMQSRRGLTHIASVLGSAPPTQDKVNTNFEVTRKGGRPPASTFSSPLFKKSYMDLCQDLLFFSSSSFALDRICVGEKEAEAGSCLGELGPNSSSKTANEHIAFERLNKIQCSQSEDFKRKNIQEDSRLQKRRREL